jgi:hypothetical protein
MKIAILGSRGIPNQYGGFEQLAEMLAVGLVAKGADVTVYNPHNHPYKKAEWNGVHIIHKYCPSKKMGTYSQFLYDLNCIRDSRSRGFDIIYQLGYTSSSIWYWLHPRKAIVITNMDGIEWQRAKYGWFARQFLKYAEMVAVIRSHFLVADSLAIKDYLKHKFGVEAHYISYGADVLHDPDPEILREFNLEPGKYYLNIARYQPDNHQEEIIKGVLHSETGFPLVLIGDYTNAFGKYLKKKYTDKRIIFAEAIFDKTKLSNLRHFANLYFHGHSGGGTNPSLLEAMGAGALICAHDNAFNREVLSENSFYFKTANDISDVISSQPEKENYQNRIQNNRMVIENKYNWASVIEACQTLFLSCLNRLKS